MPSRQKMTGWYDPVRLLTIGIRVAEATVFGRMFDRRELIATLDPFERSDFDANCEFSSTSHLASDGNFWLDFCADTGDGWRPTYAVARLLARLQLKPAPSPHRAGAGVHPVWSRNRSNCTQSHEPASSLCDVAHLGDAASGLK